MKPIDIIVDREHVSTFMYYRDGDLWYITDTGFEFPVSIADLGSATVKATEKSLLLMRYIRRHLCMINKAKEENNEKDIN